MHRLTEPGADFGAKQLLCGDLLDQAREGEGEEELRLGTLIWAPALHSLSGCLSTWEHGSSPAGLGVSLPHPAHTLV